MKGDFPLSHDLPSSIGVDCSRLMRPIHPMFAVRLRVFADWHRHEGRAVSVVAPTDPGTRRLFESMRIDPAQASQESEPDAVLPVANWRSPMMRR